MSKTNPANINHTRGITDGENTEIRTSVLSTQSSVLKRDLGKVERFEDLIAWQKARELTRAVYQVTRNGSFAKDFGLSDQIQRAAVSAMSNLAEGFERGGRGEFHQFLSTAKASCAEVRSHLYVALDVGYLEQSGFDQLLTQAAEVGRIIGGLRASVDRQRDKTRTAHRADLRANGSR